MSFVKTEASWQSFLMAVQWPPSIQVCTSDITSGKVIPLENILFWLQLLNWNRPNEIGLLKMPLLLPVQNSEKRTDYANQIL